MFLSFRISVLAWLVAIMFFTAHCAAAEYLVSVNDFGAVADAGKVDGVWIGTDNAKAINACATYCRRKGLTMFIPKGNYGVASTVWLTNPAADGHKQASITVIGPNRGAFADQSDSAKICTVGANGQLTERELKWSKHK
jgi:hypothetical protein